MKETNWELIAKHLANETNSEEESEFNRLMESDADFKLEYEASKSSWNQLELPAQSFNKARVQLLRDAKIKQTERKKLFQSTLKYAAIFIGFAMAALFVYSDLTSTITQVADNGKTMEVLLPDGSVIMMKSGTQVTYSNSRIIGFDRKIKLQGQAYFEIAKSHGKNFIVETNEYNIEVLGTKFNVATNTANTSVVLTEGSIALNHFKNSNINDTKLVPGQMAAFNHNSQELSIRNVNTRIYTSWTNHKLKFDDFSMAELGEIFKIHYNKTLVVDQSLMLDDKIGGSAPIDDFHLIIDGLSLVLKREIIERNDTIFIK